MRDEDTLDFEDLGLPTGFGDDIVNIDDELGVVKAFHSGKY